MSIMLSRPLPAAGTPTRYEIYRGPALDQVITLLDTVTFPGNNYDPVKQIFFYIDTTGDSSMYYRLIAYDANNVILDDSGPYAFSPNTAAAVPTLVRVDHNYGGPNALQYLASSGAGVPGAKIRIYKQADYLQNLVDQALAVTETDVDGTWLAPVYLPPGLTYVVLFSLQGSFGPDPVTIVV